MLVCVCLVLYAYLPSAVLTCNCLYVYVYYTAHVLAFGGAWCVSLTPLLQCFVSGESSACCVLAFMYWWTACRLLDTRCLSYTRTCLPLCNYSHAITVGRFLCSGVRPFSQFQLLSGTLFCLYTLLYTARLLFFSCARAYHTHTRVCVVCVCLTCFISRLLARAFCALPRALTVTGSFPERSRSLLLWSLQDRSQNVPDLAFFGCSGVFPERSQPC